MPKNGASTKPLPAATPNPANARPRRASAAKRGRGVRTAPARVDDFPVVGIGCSAGGLEALEAFLAKVPAGSGIAFVVIQHLDPTHGSILPELLQRATPMPVVEAGNRMPVKPDHVYVIPPNKDISLLHGTLHLLDPTERRGLRLPVDFFLRTLADDRQGKAIGVILSGMGSDGMLGMRAIKEKAGLTLAQTPATAKADSMPNSVIGAGLADIVAPAGELPALIIDYLDRAPHRSLPELIPEQVKPSALEKIIILLRDRTSNDFSLYKTSTLYRRIERRSALHHVSGIADYVDFLRGNPQELDLLFRELLIGVTSFFRDPAVWDLLGATAIPELLARYPAGRALRAWVPACSSGEEAYSLAIVFREAIERIKPEGHFTLQIYATDLDHDAIDRARKGLYPPNIVADVAPERLARCFTAEDDDFLINKDIREMVIFAPQNIISDPPFTKLDLLSCRNLLIYFSADLQKKLFPLFHYALNLNGILLLGSAESLGAFSALFSPFDHKARLFRRNAPEQALAAVEFPARASLPVAAELMRPERLGNLATLTDQLIQQNYAPAAVLVNRDGDILYISGRTGKYLEPAAGKVNINIYAMARDGLREALTGVIRRALQDTLPVRLDNLQIGTNGGTQAVNVTVIGLQKPEALRGRVLIVFNDVAAQRPARRLRKGETTPAASALALELQQTLEALQYTREILQVTHEEMQTSVEELKSSNEELQSTNEELQSNNEEVTTSREALQSLNEELQTVNAELQSKVDELSMVKNDMTNLLNSTEIATIFLDGEMQVRRFTPHATRLFKLIPGDVGRPLSDIVSKLDYPDLRQDAENVLQTLLISEKRLRTHDGGNFRVRIMPYRTQDNVIDGVVITFIDLAAARGRGRARPIDPPATNGGQQP